MVKIDRIVHTVTIPEGVTADYSEDGVAVSYTHLTLPTTTPV